MNIELKPCPFCGGEAEMMGDQYPYVECQKCAGGFTANHSYDADEGDAANKWNARSAAGDSARAQGGQVEETSLPPFDPNKPRDEQGLYGKFLVRRMDGSDLPGGKHHGCKYFVLDVDHDKYAAAALGTYASQCEQEYPLLAKDLREKFGAQGGQPQPAVPEAKIIIDRVVEELENGFVACERCGDQEDTATLDCMTDLKRLKAILSTPTTPQADGWVLMPEELTAENGAKSLLMSEFHEVVELECGACDADDEDCEVCGGNGSYTYRVPVSWPTIKSIYRLAVEKLKRPQPPAGQEGDTQ